MSQQNEKRLALVKSPMAGEEGKIGYLIAWILGVPAWILLLVFLIKG